MELFWRASSPRFNKLSCLQNNAGCLNVKGATTCLLAGWLAGQAGLLGILFPGGRNEGRAAITQAATSMSRPEGHCMGAENLSVGDGGDGRDSRQQLRP